MANTPYYTKAETDAIEANLRRQYNYGASEYRGYLAIVDTPTLDGWYWATQIGTYDKAGNLQTVANKINMIEKDGVTFRLNVIDVPVTPVVDGFASSSTTSAGSANNDRLLDLKIDQLLIKENWISDSFINKKEWILISGGSLIEDEFIIKANGAQAKLQIPTNQVINGEKYLLLCNIEKLTALNNNVTGIAVYNNTQAILTYLNNDTRKIISVPFTADNGGENLQIIVLGDNVNTSSIVPIGTDLISITTDFIGFIPWTQEKEDLYNECQIAYKGGGFSTLFTAKSGNSQTSINSNFATKSISSEISKQLESHFKFTNEEQIIPSKWTLWNGASLENKTFNFNYNSVYGSSRIQVNSTVNIGQKYIAFGYIDNPVKLNINAVSADFYNYSTNLFSFSLTESNFNYSVFEPTVSGIIQIIIAGNFSSVADGTDICSFETNCLGIVPWSQELEELMIQVKSGYEGGSLNFSKSLFDYQKISFPSTSFESIDSLSNRVNNTYSTTIPSWTSLSGATNITNEVVNGVFRIGGTANYNDEPLPRLWWGFDMQPSNYATVEKTYVYVFEGTINSVNVDDFYFVQATGASLVITQDLVDNTLRNFKTLISFTYPAGAPIGNNRYISTYLTRKNASIANVSFLAEFTTFAVFEEIVGFGIDDYIAASKNTTIIPLYNKIGTASEAFVTQSIESAVGNVSKLTPEDLITKFDIEMLLSGGQSLNVGGTASDSQVDWENTPTFALGSSLYLRDFTTELQKEAFFGNSFSLLENNNANEQYPPVTASTNVVLSLLQSENKVNVSTFGVQIMPFTWGVSGSSITFFEKGTVAYNDMISVVTKSKEFANKEGKTFGVRAMNWYQGEADNFQSKLWYYDKMSNLFIDINTDIKAITGQTDDIQFFTYQTNPWLGRDLGNGVMTQINIQEAQVQVARDFTNVHIAGAMYQFNYSDVFHPVDRAIVGLQTGVAIKRVCYDNKTWGDFKPISHTVITDGTKFFIHLKFDVPVKPARFDTSGLIWHNENGKQTNFGFEIRNNNIEMQTAEPFIVRADTVVLTTNVNPLGFEIRYAVNGSQGGGNLCDSQNIIVRNKGIDYIVDNFAVGFEKYII